MKAIDGIREYQEKATEGPWWVEDNPAYINLELDAFLNSHSFRVTKDNCPSKWGLIPQGILPKPDATFVANARTDLPLLLAVVEAALEVNNAAQVDGPMPVRMWQPLTKVRDALAALEREWSGATKQEGV